MITLSSISGIFLLEGCLVLALLIIILLLRSINKSSNNNKAIDAVISQIEDNERSRMKRLTSLVSEHCEIEKTELKKVINKVSFNEKQLYKKILQVFLNQDETLLDDFEQHINDLNEPYLQMILLASMKGNATALATQKEETFFAMQELKASNKLLHQKLNETIATMEEITAEYKTVFKGTPTASQLEVSSKKMFNIFRYVEQRAKATEKKLSLKA